MEESAAETRGSDEALSVYPSLAMTGYLSISLIFYVENDKKSLYLTCWIDLSLLI